MSRTSRRLASAGAVVNAVRVATRPGSPSLGERASAVPRLVKAVVTGRYTGTSPGRLLMLLGAAGYLVAPVDVMPEALLGPLGLADDALVIGWLATRLVEETEAFIEWERTGAAPTDRTPPRRGSSGETVRGDVVG